MPTRSDVQIGSAEEKLENLRIGTRVQYESEWVLIRASTAHEFLHGLSEIPWCVDVIYSESNDGSLARENANLTTPATFTKSSTSVELTNNESLDYYFQVRAM